MDDISKESRINGAFIAVANTLTRDFDVVDLLHTLVDQCTSILDTDAGGLMLADSTRRLQLMTSTSEAADFVEVMQLNADSGPCIDCFASGTMVSVPDITDAGDVWPAFRRAALAAGFRSAHATPLKLHGQIIGTMNLFSSRLGALSARDAATAQALSDIATIGILQERVGRERAIIPEQLHRALDSRILIEQAKGVVAQSLGITMDEAFGLLRSHAHNSELTIRAVAERISARSLAPRSLSSLAEAPRR